VPDGEPRGPAVDETWYDVVVVGGGAAGLSGALALGRARRRVLLVDAGQPRNAPASHVHTFLTRDGVPPAEFLAVGREEVRRYGTELVEGRVTAAERAGRGFAVTLSDGRTVHARRVLLATGLVDELPDVPGLAQRWGRDVLHCPYCHGWESRDRRLGVLATSRLAVTAAETWRQWSGDVVLLQHRAEAPSGGDAERLAALGVRVVEGAVTGVELDGDRLAGVRLVTGEVVALDAVVVTPRHVARADVAASLGLEIVDVTAGTEVLGRQIAAYPTGATAVPGVWVAGNAGDVRGQLVSMAAAGAEAGAAINADLTGEDTREAVTALRASLATQPA